MSHTPKRSCQQAAKLHHIQAAAEIHNAPSTPGFSLFGALSDEGENPPSSQAQGRQEVSESDPDSSAEITHHSSEEGGATAQAAPAKTSRQGLSSEEKERVGLLIAYGYSLRQAAVQIKRAHTTVSRQLKKDPQFAAQVERYRSYAETDALHEVIKAGKKSWRAAAWLLTYLQRRDEIENAELAS